MIVAWVLLGATVGVATTRPGGLTPRGLISALAFVTALAALLVTDQHDALAGILVGYGVTVVADGIRTAVRHLRRTTPGPEP